MDACGSFLLFLQFLIENSEDPHQTTHHAASDLGLLFPFVPK